MTLDACQRLVRRLTALSEPQQRVVILAEEAQRLGMDAFADLIAVMVARASEHKKEWAQVTLAALSAYLQSEFLDDKSKAQMLAACREAGHHQLLRLLFSPPSQQKVETKKVPDYGVGRPLTLGERKSLARRPTRNILERVMADPHPAVIKNLMRNPMLTEEDVLRLITRRPNYEEVLTEISKSPRWNLRYNVRLALARNPYTPPSISLKILPQLMRQDLKEMLQDRTLHSSVTLSCRRLVEGEEPPIESGGEDTTLH